VKSSVGVPVVLVIPGSSTSSSLFKLMVVN
ncbi:MAG: hypothetical protein QOG05_7115, partial [Streptosporangiaceae bacterium]|nr:hypothetical protein [Streptosporangiaceae bacterium]